MVAVQSYKWPLWADLMHFLGHLCSGEGLVGIHAALYWVISPYLCVYGIWLVPVMEIANGLIKWVARAPRPGWTNPDIELRAWSHEYSFPSSHAQVSFALSTFACWSDETGVLAKIVALSLASLVAFSRIYEGLHWPHDIATGALLGTLSTAIHITYFVPCLDAMFASDTVQWSFIAYSLVFAFGSLGTVLVAYHFTRLARAAEREKDGGTDKAHAAWLATAHSTRLKAQKRKFEASNKSKQVSKEVQDAQEAKLEELGKLTLDPLGIPLADYVGMCGVLCGLAVGQPLIVAVEGGAHKLAPPAGAFPAIARLLVGMLLLFSIFLGLRAVEKHALTPGTALSWSCRFVRYASVPLVILEVAPTAFHACGI